MVSPAHPPDPDTGHSIFSRITPAHARALVSPHGAAPQMEIPALPWNAPAKDGPTDPRSALEQGYTGVVTLLARVWGQPEADAAFRRLILDGSGQMRHWPQAAWEDLMLLRDVHAIAYVHGRDLPADPDTGRVDPARFPVLEVRYRHVLERIIRHWGDPVGFSALFMDLIIDRRGTRTGWPPEVWSELVFLQAVHDRAYGAPKIQRRTEQDFVMTDRVTTG